ncbi:MAG: DUF4349 domain-containing protein [Gaiellaceae bacterium]|jgi:hypothetical protein
MTSDAILAELRGMRGAPETLRERVLAIPEPQPRVFWSLPRLDFRRFALVAAPAVLALGLGAAALHGVVSGGSSSRPVAVDGNPPAWELAPNVTHSASGGASFGAAKALSGRTVRALPPSSTRLNKYEAWLRVQVADDRLSSATTRAMQIVRAYGGYVALVDMNTPGNKGTASLVLRVPVTRVEDAVLRLGKLGEVKAQRVKIQDLTRQANVLRRQIVALQATVAKLEHKLAAGGLPPDVRLRLQYQLDEAKRSLAQKTKTRAGTVREGTLATVSLAFSTPQAAAVAPHHPGRLERTARDAGTFLVRELAWLLYAVIVLAPIALLAAALVFGVRTGRRRSEDRLLAQP